MSIDKQDLARFRYAGYPSPVQAADDPNREELFNSVCRVLDSPSARLMAAAALTMVKIAEGGDLVGLVERQECEHPRMLGYLARRTSGLKCAGPEESRRLNDLADYLYRPEFAEAELQTFLPNATDAYCRILKNKADEVSGRWQVYGDIPTSVWQVSTSRKTINARPVPLPYNGDNS